MKLIAGLGNIGTEYINTRHNVGFLFLDFLHKKNFNNFNFSLSKNINCYTFKSDDLIFIKPNGFMNNSGELVKKALSYYKIPSTGLAVIHDDIDLPIGSYKMVNNGGSGGHKGVESIQNILKTNDFLRIKIGVAPFNYNPSLNKAVDFVLKPFTNLELEQLDTAFNTLYFKMDQILN